MAIPPGSLRVDYDFSNPACYSGSGITIYDLSGNNIFSTTNATYVSQGPSSHFSFNGTNQVSNSKFFFTNNQTTFTFNIWFQSNNTTSDRRIINFTAPYGFYLAVNASNSYSYVMTGPGYGPTLTNQNTVSTWTLYSCVSDGTTAKFFKNGVLVSSGAFTGGLPSGENLFSIGGRQTGLYAKCKIARFQYYNVAIDDADILQYYNDTKVIFPAAQYDLSNATSYSGSGNTIFDVAGANNLTLFNSPVFSSAGQSSYLTFNDPINPPSNQYAATSSLAGITTNPWTFSLWYDPIDNTLSNEFLWTFGFNNYLSTPLGVWKDTSGNNFYKLEWGSDGIQTNVTPVAGWNNLIVSSFNNNATIYLNGTSIGTKAITTGAVSGNSFLGIGALVGPNNITENSLYARMKFAIFQAYNYGVDSTEALALFNSQSSRFPPPPETDLKVSYDLSDVNSYPGTGNTLFDLSEYDNNLTLVNSPSFSSVGQSSFLTFDSASDQYGNRGAITGISTTPFTFNLWYVPTEYDNTEGNLYTYGLNANQFYAKQELDSGNKMQIGSAQGYIEPTRPPLYNWANLIVTVDASNLLTAYINGSSVGTTTMTGFSIAATPNFLLPSTNGFADIKLGLFEAYNVAFGSTEVADLYNATVSRFPQPSPYVGSVGGRQFGQGFNG